MDCCVASFTSESLSAHFVSSVWGCDTLRHLVRCPLWYARMRWTLVVSLAAKEGLQLGQQLWRMYLDTNMSKFCAFFRASPRRSMIRLPPRMRIRGFLCQATHVASVILRPPCRGGAPRLASVQSIPGVGSPLRSPSHALSPCLSYGTPLPRACSGTVASICSPLSGPDLRLRLWCTSGAPDRAEVGRSMVRFVSVLFRLRLCSALLPSHPSFRLASVSALGKRRSSLTFLFGQVLVPSWRRLPSSRSLTS